MSWASAGVCLEGGVFGQGGESSGVPAVDAGKVGAEVIHDKVFGGGV